MDYLDLVEEYVIDTEADIEDSITIFEKVLVIAKRAKDLSHGKTCMIDGLEGHNEITKAHYEFLENKITPLILEEAPVEIIDEDIPEVEEPTDEGTDKTAEKLPS